MDYREKKSSSRNLNKKIKCQPTTKETQYYALDVTYHCGQHENQESSLLNILKRWFTCKQYHPQSDSEDIMLVTTIK